MIDDEFEDIAMMTRATDRVYSVKKTEKDITVDGVVLRHCWHCKTYKPLLKEYGARKPKTVIGNLSSKKCYQSMCRACMTLYSQKRARIKKRQRIGKDTK